MLNKSELIDRIENLPTYEFKEIFIEKNEDFKRQTRFKAIVEVDKTEALSIVTDRYRLVQFKDVLLPIVENLGNLEGENKIYKGEGYTLIFPDKQELNLEKGKLGLVIFNSVTKKYAVLIDFVVWVNNTFIFLPKKVKAFKNKHIGNIKEVVKDYETILENSKEDWNTISNKFNRTISQEEYDFIIGELHLGKRIEKKMNEEFNKGEIVLWDLMIEVIKNIQDREYKNEVNKMMKIKFISDTITKFVFLEKLK